MPTYAKNTEVSSSTSRAEIDRTLQRFGASAFMYGWEGRKAVIGFEIGGRRYRMVMTMPDREDDRFLRTPSRGYIRSPEEAEKAWEQECREYWRALAVLIKGILAAAEVGIITVEVALQPFAVLPNGQTVGEWMAPQIEQAYQSGRMPPMLMLGDGK